MFDGMDDVTLTPELKRFAAEAVASGRYRNLSEVVAAGMRLLQREEADVAAFVDSLEAARAEADRDGWISLDEMTAEMDRIIAELADRAA
jgi:putative addiction module CopG family antidote